MSTWPNAQEYTASVSNPRLNFLDPEIKLATPELNNLQIPRPRSGTYAVVYHLQGPQSDFAIRCFLKDFADQQERYAAISQTLKASGLPFTVTFDFLSQGIQVNRKWYPVLKMAWVKGEQLNRYIENNLRNPNKLIALANQLKEIIDAMQQHQIAHCDLQNGNILVSNDRLFLIDYDGMYVPQLFGRGSHEQGHPNFQHPLRSGHNFGPTIDNFSAWVIYFSLIALAIDPSLWTATGAKDNPDQLLFSRKDFNNPNNSSTLRLLTKHSNSTIQGLGILFHSMLFYDVEQVPSLDQDPTLSAGSIISPQTPTPAWYKSHPNSNASTSTSPSSANSPTSSATASSWIIESLAANKNIVPVSFSSPLTVPRILVYTSATAITIALFLLVFVPNFLLPIGAGATLLVAINLMVLTIAYERDPSIQEARTVLVEIQKENLELQAVSAIVQEADKRKTELNKQHEKGCDILQKQYNKHKAGEKTEIDKLNQNLNATITDISNRRQKLLSAENSEITALQSTATGSRISKLNSLIQSVSGNEYREIQIALSNLQSAHLQAYMHSQHIRNASIPGVGDKLKAALAHQGYQTAGDINSGILNVPGIGQSKASSLESWRRSHEAVAHRSMPANLPAPTLNHIKAKYSLEKSTMESEIATLQVSFNRDEMAIRAKFQQQRNRFNEEQTIAQQNNGKQMKAIQTRYAQEYTNIDQLITEKQLALAKQFSDIDKDTRDANKQLFAAKLRVAKTKQKFEPYRKLTFKNFIKTLIFNKAA